MCGVGQTIPGRSDSPRTDAPHTKNDGLHHGPGLIAPGCLSRWRSCRHREARRWPALCQVIPAGIILLFLALLAVVAAGSATSLTTDSTVTTLSFVFCTVIASPPVTMIHIISNRYRRHLAIAIAEQIILRYPKLARYRAQEMVSSAKFAPWLELHPG